jgi:hypothetical protein
VGKIPTGGIRMIPCEGFEMTFAKVDLRECIDLKYFTFYENT